MRTGVLIFVQACARYSEMGYAGGANASRSVFLGGPVVRHPVDACSSSYREDRRIAAVSVSGLARPRSAEWFRTPPSISQVNKTTPTSSQAGSVDESTAGRDERTLQMPFLGPSVSGSTKPGPAFAIGWQPWGGQCFERVLLICFRATRTQKPVSEIVARKPDGTPPR